MSESKKAIKAIDSAIGDRFQSQLITQGNSLLILSTSKSGDINELPAERINELSSVVSFLIFKEFEMAPKDCVYDLIKVIVSFRSEELEYSYDWSTLERIEQIKLYSDSFIDALINRDSLSMRSLLKADIFDMHMKSLLNRLNLPTASESSLKSASFSGFSLMENEFYQMHYIVSSSNKNYTLIILLKMNPEKKEFSIYGLAN